MPRKPKDPTATIPPGCERPIRKTLRVDLLKMIGLLLDHLTPVLCETVFRQQRLPYTNYEGNRLTEYFAWEDYAA